MHACILHRSAGRSGQVGQVGQVGQSVGRSVRLGWAGLPSQPAACIVVERSTEWCSVV